MMVPVKRRLGCPCGSAYCAPMQTIPEDAWQAGAGTVDDALVNTPLLASFEASARRDPEAPAVADPARVLTYRQLWNAAIALADSVAEATRPGDRVGVRLSAGVEFVASRSWHACTNRPASPCRSTPPIRPAAPPRSLAPPASAWHSATRTWTTARCAGARWIGSTPPARCAPRRAPRSRPMLRPSSSRRPAVRACRGS